MLSKTHISYLDSIRGLAALSVISEHYVIAYGLPCENRLCQRLLDDSPLHFWWDGGAAVSMFFVLSGLVLSLKYFRNGHKPDLNQFSLIAYLTGRLFRIWLPYCVILQVSALLYLQVTDTPFLITHLLPSDWIIDMWHKHPLSKTDMLREGFLLNLPANNVLLPQAWTLKIELILSLLLPIGLLLADRGSVWLIFFTLFAAMFLGVSIFLLHFLLGLLIARYYVPVSEYLTRKTLLRRLTLLIGFFLYTSGNVLPNTISETVIWLSSGLGAGLIILFVLASARAQKFLSQPLLRQIGKISYSAYLIHMAILICLTPNLLKALEVLTLNRWVLWVGGWLLTLAVVQLFSLLSYHYLETPSISIGKRIADAIKAPNKKLACS